MTAFSQAIVQSTGFSRFIIGVIIFAGILVGIQTFPETEARYHTLLQGLDQAVLWIFVIEIILKMIALSPRPHHFFKDGWNVFDFVIVALCFLPIGGSFVAVFRLIRLLRVLRLITVIPRLQIIVGGLLKSLPSMVYVLILLSMLFYIYGVLGVLLFRENDPVHFGNLWTSLLSLFRVVTLEDWTDVMYLQMFGSDTYQGYNQSTAGMEITPKAQPVVGAIYFVSFVLLGTMIMLNLVIGVVLNGMEDAQKEIADQALHRMLTQKKDTGELTRSDKIEELRARLQEISKELDHFA